MPFPYTIQGRGEGIYVVNIVAINCYKILDFMTCRCDRHYLDRVLAPRSRSASPWAAAASAAKSATRI